MIATGLVGLALVGMSLFALSPKERLTQRSVLKSVPGVRNSRQATAPTKPAAKSASMNGKSPEAKPPADDAWSGDVTGASTPQCSWYGRNSDPLRAERPEWTAFSLPSTVHDTWSSDGWFANFDPRKSERPQWDQFSVRTSCVYPEGTEEAAPAVETRELGGVDSRVSNAHPLIDPLSALREFTVRAAFTEPDAFSSDGWFGNFDPQQAERPQWDQLSVRTSCVEPKRTVEAAPAVEMRELGCIDTGVSNAHPLSFTVRAAFTEPDAFSSNVWFGNVDPLQAERPQWDQFSVRTSCVEPQGTEEAANDTWSSDGWFANFDPRKAERPTWDQLSVRTSCVEPKGTEEAAPAVETRELGGVDSRVSNAHPLIDPLSALREFTVCAAFTEPDAFSSDGWFGNFDPLQAERPQWDQLSVRTACRTADLVS